MNRRYFLTGISTIAISQLLVGCGGKQQAQLKVNLLKDSIPGRVVDQFSRSFKQKTQLKFAAVEQLQTLFQQLRTWQQPPKPSKQQPFHISLPFWQSQPDKIADVVTMGNYWLDVAIQQGLIQPLDVDKIANWSNLPGEWQQLVRRNNKGELDSQGKVWAAPYRWGTTMMVYRRDKLEKLGWKPQDWSDLWREELRDRISLLDQPREVVGLVLKKLGKSYNTENLDSVPELESQLRSLNQQVKFYSSNQYLEPLLIEDTWLAVGWSNDILPAIIRNPELSAVIPKSGTALWADMWVCPQKTESTNQSDRDLLYQWINFCWQPEVAKQIALLTRTNSPIATQIQPSELQQPLRDILLDNQVFSQSEFIRFLTPTVTEKYESLFAKITTNKS